MRVLVCGGRDYSDRAALFATLDRLAAVLRVDTIIEGAARGADSLAYEWARERRVDFETYPAYWSVDGKRAGAIRNQRMLSEGHPDLVVGFPTDKSVGTWHMLKIARAAGVTTWVMPADLAEISGLEVPVGT